MSTCVLFLLITTALISSVLSDDPAPDCNPGFIPRTQFDDINDTTVCFCDEGSYHSLITCNSTSTEAIILNGGWIGNYSGQILAGSSIYLYNIDNSLGVTLPSNWSSVDNRLCGGIYRTGILCGNCIHGYAPSTNLFSHRCVKCTPADTHINWLWYIVLEYVPLTIMFLFLVIFNINTTSGSANAFIFYAQMITSIFDLSKNGVIPLKDVTFNKSRFVTSLYSIPYGIWNLEFLSSLFHPFCLADTGTYGIILVNYAIAIYPILLILFCCFVVWLYNKGINVAVFLCRPIYRCILKVQRKWQFRRSMIGVFSTFITMSYTKMLMVSFQLVTPAHLVNSDGDIVYSNIPGYNGNHLYSDASMTLIYMSAIVTLVIYIAILPLLLMTPSIIKALHRRTGWDWLARILPWGRLQMFLEGFHSCYVEGESRFDCSDYRWFSGIFLILRALFFLIYTFAPSTMATYTYMGGLCFLSVFLIALLRPFKRTLHNTLHVGVFCLLGTISYTCAYCWYQSWMWYDIPPLLFWSEYVLVFVPLIMLIFAVCKWLVGKWKRKSAHRRMVKFDTGEEKDEKDIKTDDAFDFMKFTEESGRLKRDSRDKTWYISSVSSNSDDNSSIKGYGTIN